MGEPIRNYVNVVLLVQHEYFSVVHTLAWQPLVWHKLSHLALLLEVLPHNIGVISIGYLLPTYHGKGNMSLGAFSYLEMATIMRVWLVL